MNNKNNHNSYILLLHHNPTIKTIEDFMDYNHIYEVDDKGNVLSIDKSSDEFFKFNKDFIWSQMNEFDKMTIKSENGTYPTSSSDITKTNTLPCPCKLKVKSSNITAEISVNATNLQENTSDVYAFENDKIQDLYQDDGFVTDVSEKRNLDCYVFGWFKSLYYAYSIDATKKQSSINKQQFSEFANISKHIISLSTNVSNNGGSFIIRLPMINSENMPSDLYTNEFKTQNIYVGRGKKNEYKFDENKQYFAKSNFNKSENNYFNWLISNNDLLFISFEKLVMETNRESNKSTYGDEDNFDIKTAIANHVYDMIGLVDNVKVVTSSVSAEAYIEVSGRDLMKLLIDDGSWFFNDSTVADPSSVFANDQSYGNSGDIRDVVTVNGKYGAPPIGRLRRPGGEIDIFSNQLNMSIDYILKAVLSQLSNIEVVPNFVFDSWGDDRTKYNDFYQTKQ